MCFVCGVCACGVVCTCGVVCACGVVCVSLLTCLFLFLFLSLSFFFTARTETRSDRQVTLPIKNGHAPRDIVSREELSTHTHSLEQTHQHHEPRAPNFHNTNSKENNTPTHTRNTHIRTRTQTPPHRNKHETNATNNDTHAQKPQYKP